MKTINSTQKIGEIVNQFPKSSNIFKQYRVDYCCGGDRILKDVLIEQGINEEKILGEINESYSNYIKEKSVERNWLEEPLNVLVEHILNTHHAYLNANLPVIQELVTKILRVHGENHPELLKVHRLFSNLKAELEAHLFKEETIQYPAIEAYLKTYNQSDLDRAISVIKELDEEHVGAGDVLKELRSITNDYEIPQDGCRTYQKTYDKLVELESDMFEHIHLENNVLFPRLYQLKK